LLKARFLREPGGTVANRKYRYVALRGNARKGPHAIPGRKN
jgi:hypothetical protein